MPTGGPEEKDVNFYDYDGTLLYSYSKADFLELTEMPANPTHEGLTAQGWNWSLQDAKTYVTDYNKLQLGQMYNTVSEKTEIDIELTTVTGLSVTLNMNGTKDWGDGNSDDLTSHTYSQAGEYTILCDGNSITDKIFGQSSLSQNYYCKFIRFSNITDIGSQKIMYSNSLQYITLPTSITTIQDYAFQYCSLLTSVVIPSSIATLAGYGVFQNCTNLQYCFFPKFTSTFSLANNCFVNCYSLKRITLSENFTGLGTSAFSNIRILERINLPKSITTIANYCFSSTTALKVLDFSKYTSIPTLSNRNAFDSVNALLKIIVSDSLYSTWRTEGNWIYMQNYIVSASDV